jgi:hypothetical protein
MSLAFALITAINGSAGSSATLSHGLKGTKPRRRQCDGDKDSHPSWATAQAVPRSRGDRLVVTCHTSDAHAELGSSKPRRASASVPEQLALAGHQLRAFGALCEKSSARVAN